MKRGVYKYLKNDRFHNGYRLKEIETNEELTDLEEIHFIEMPKFKNLNNKDLENDKLQRWLMFLRNDISESELEELIDMDNDIKKAEEKLEYLSSDPVTQELYFERERALHEKANLINTGIKQGIKQEKIEMARKLLQNNFSV